MYEKLIDIGLKCAEEKGVPACYYFDCPYSKLDFPNCEHKLISDLTEALMTIESYNAWNEDAARSLKSKLDRIQFIEEKR